MVAGLSPRRAVQAAVLALALVAGAGCEAPVTSYPEHLTFPPRADLLVDRLPTEAPQDPGPPQDLDKFLARIDGLGGRTFDPAALPADQRSQIQQSLTDLFGTPASPTLAADGETRPLADRLGLTSERLVEGGRLFRRHCQQCHGITGDGRGPTGLWVTPHPRDFRAGIFKFVSTAGTGPRKPCRADLLRTLREGLPGSRMPAFDLLPEEQRDLLAGYVTFLSVRGQIEAALLKVRLDPNAGSEADVPTDARASLRAALGQWVRAEEEPMRSEVPPDLNSPEPNPAPDPESVRRGFALFTDAKGPAACVTCHEDFGRKAKYRFDVWGTLVRPADLTGRDYKGGKRPIDLYCRVRGGIGPVGMPAPTGLSDGQVWDLVRFIRALPYPAQLPPDVRGRVYPEQVGMAGR